MSFSAFASLALLALAVPHAAPAHSAPGAAAVVRPAAPTASFKRLKFLGVTSPGAAAAVQSLSVNQGGMEFRLPNRRGHNAADVRPNLGRALGATAAAVSIPTAPGLSVVAPDAGFFGFPGLTHTQQRQAGTGVYANTQFSLEPPDQGLCVGNGFVMETVNDALAVYDARGKLLSGPTANNQFLHLAPEVNRNSQPRLNGPFLSDPRCHFDIDTQRWFFTEFEEDHNVLTGTPTGATAVFMAVSQTADPRGAYSIYAFDTTNLEHTNCPCLPDQPLLGFDANGMYITTNEFPLFVPPPAFNGAQIYALSKLALAAGVLPTVVHINAGALPTPDAGGIWYSIQPATSPDPSQQVTARNGTEFFLSALQFGPAPYDNRIAAWSLTNTRSLSNAKPNVTLQHVVISSVAYGNPPPSAQRPGPTPLADSVGEKLEKLDSGDDRMEQVVYSRGRLWAGLNTAVRVGSSTNAGIAYFVVTPQFAANGNLGARMTAGGYVAVAGQNVMYPSIGVNANAVPVMAFTLVGPNYFPSSAYVTQNAGRVSNVKLARAGTAPDDGFSGYLAYGGAGVGRWGDYSAAVADRDGSIWFANEYIPNVIHTPAGTPLPLANWGTFIGHVPTH